MSVGTTLSVEQELVVDPTSPWFDEDFGATGQCDELPPCQTPTASDPNPGRFELDPEENDVNTLDAMEAEENRLYGMFPGADVLVTKETRVFHSGTTGARLRSVQWHVSVGYEGSRGFCMGDVNTTTLREACDAAASDFRAKLLDNAARVTAAVAEMRVA